MKKQYEDDDGRTICPMDVEGIRGSAFVPVANRWRKPSCKNIEGETVPSSSVEKISRSDARKYSLYAIFAGLTVIGVIGGGVILFIFILTRAWA